MTIQAKVAATKRLMDHELTVCAEAPQIIEMLDSGTSVREVSRWLIEDKGVFKDRTQSALEKLIGRWNKTRDIATGTAEMVVTEINELDLLAKLQWERLEQARKAESALPILLPTVVKEIAEYKAIIKLKNDMKSASGMYKTPEVEGPQTLVQNNTTIINNTNSLSESVKGMVDDPKSRKRILGAVEALVKPELTPEEQFSRRFKVSDRSDEVVDVTPNVVS